MTERTQPASAQGGSGLSLLSLSIVAANASPIPVSHDDSPPESVVENSFHDSGLYESSAGSVPRSISNGPAVQHALKPRRLSSTGQMKRRMSDARDAASRPSPMGLQNAASALTALANLSLSTSSGVQGGAFSATSTSFASASAALSSPVPIKAASNTTVQISTRPSKAEEAAQSLPSDLTVPDAQAGSVDSKANAGNGTTKNGKKRGMIFTCESCSKVYRHPSCLIKHRWEHSPHWREASKFLLSKHQQVQLMEAAAILSHLSPTTSGGSSLPDDRSLWPSYLSGGLLPPPSDATTSATSTTRPPLNASVSAPAHPISSSVPATSNISSTSSSRATSTGPRLHDYSIPSTASGAGGITQLRPGVLGVATKSESSSGSTTRLGFSGSGPTRVMSPYAHETITSSSAPVAVPNIHGHVHLNSSPAPESWGSSSVASYRQPFYPSPGSYSYSSSIAALPAHPSSLAQSFTRSEGTGAWSVSGSSRSPSIPPSVDMDEDVDIDVDGDGDIDLGGGGLSGYGFSSRTRAARTSLMRYDGFSVKEEEEDEMEFDGRGKAAEEEDWDGMEMEMEL